MSTAEPSTFARETTPSISPPPTFRVRASTASFSSPATTATATSWPAGAQPIPTPTPGSPREFSFGNGFLDRLEHRQQYKLNGFREFHFGRHDLTLFGIGYYGFSYVPGLIPIDVPVPGDTIDNRQLDITHNLLAVANDKWKLSQQRQFSFSGFYRNYALTLRSNFGDGLIQQSETRNVSGGEAMYIQSVRSWLAVMAGVDLRRDAPRNLDLRPHRRSRRLPAGHQQQPDAVIR